jgi:activator of 2-hydroxyglutaryl-CoA dehydratase
MKNIYLGIDIGSIAIAVAIIDENNQISFTSYTFHKGR